MNVEEIKEYLKSSLSEKRYKHSVLAAEAAESLAKKYKVDENKAYLTGLLHDIAKEFSREYALELIDKYNLPQELKKPKFNNIIHADIGAEFAKEKYNIDDEMYKSIKYHAIGNKNMSLFNKIIFVADKIGREQIPDDMKKTKELAYNKNIDEALLYFLKSQQIYLKKQSETNDIEIHPDTLELIECLIRCS